MLTKVISGGQTGVDQAGLCAAKAAGLETGGWMPKGWRTQAGPCPEFKNLFGMQETDSHGYPPRTFKNVQESDATIILGNVNSPGCKLTRRYCEELRKPWIAFDLKKLAGFMVSDTITLWIVKGKYEILNVAGNREESQPGIGKAVEALLFKVFTDLKRKQK